MTQWRIALRSLVRRPGFALTVGVLLALGIGVNTALFSVVYGVLISPLPYPDPSRLVTVFEATSAATQKQSLVAPGRLEDWNRLNTTFAAIAGSYAENVTDASQAEPERLSGLRVSPRYFAVLGATPAVGRPFTPDEERLGGPLAAVISYGLWTRRYGQDPGVANRRLIVAGKGYTIVGVMPKTFASPSIDLWIPAQAAPFLMQLRDARFMSGIGRMKPGVSIEQARADLVRVQRGLGEQFPKTDAGWSVALQDLKDARVGRSSTALVLLLGAVSVLLLITLTNIACLMLARLVQRQSEFAIRTALGATRTQVVASVMREALPLALGGALAGFGTAVVSTNLVRRLFADVPRIVEVQVDWRALSFAIAASLVAAVGFGLLPAITTTRPGGTTLAHSGRGLAGRGQRLQRLLVATEIAVTMALMASAGVLVRSFYNLNRVELGFDSHGTVLFHVGAAWDENRSRVGHLQEQLIADIQRMPGVQAAGITNFLPASGATLRHQVSLEGEANTDDTNSMPAGSRTVSPGYLKAIRAPLLAGTWCPELRTDFTAPRKAMVNRRFVEVYGRGRNIVGRHLMWREIASRGTQAADEIVGVIGDIREDAINQPAYPYVYSCAVGGGWPDPEYVVRTAGDATTLLRSVRDLVHRIDGSRAVFGAELVDDYLDRTLDRPRSNAVMLTLFALAGMMLATIGLYGVMAHTVSTRRKEIGVRIALGARPSQVVGSIVGSACVLIGAGIAAGLGLMLVAQLMLRSAVFGISPFDGPTLAIAAALLSAVSCLAALVAGRRAAAMDPIDALRAE